MSASTTLRELLEELLEHMPAHAYDITIEIPTHIVDEENTGHYPRTVEVKGRELEVWRSTGTNPDVLFIEWHEQTPAGSSVRTGQMFIPNPHRVKRSCWAAYSAARNGGEVVTSAELAAVQQEMLTLPEQEIYVQLLQDGTPWRRAFQLTKHLDDTHPSNHPR